MRKILILLISLIFVFSKVDASSINDSYLECSHGLLCADLSLIKDFFDANNADTALTQCFNGFVEVIKDRFGLDINNDVEQVGFYLLLKDNKIRPFGFISGNFNLNEIIQSVKRGNATELELFNAVVINGKRKPTLKIGQNIFVGQNYKTIWFCDEFQFKDKSKESFIFKKAPDYICELNNRSQSFFFLNKELLENLLDYDPKKSKLDLDSLNSVSAYFSNNDIVIEANLNSPDSANAMKLQLDYYLNNLKESNKTIDNTDFNLSDYNKINSIYLSARVIDIINSFKLEVRDNLLVIVFPYNRTNFYNAFSDIITNVAMPKYLESIKESNESECYHIQHYLTKSIEKFNNENEPMMTSYYESALSTNYYIPYEYLFIRERGCRYSSVGNLDDGGYVICEKHGPAKPLIKPQVSQQRLKEEEEFLKCSANLNAISLAVNSYNKSLKYQYGKTQNNLSDIPLMLEKLDIDLLKTNNFLINDLIETTNCEYYIKGNLDNNGKICCKKHGPLKKINQYDYETQEYLNRRASKLKKEALEDIKDTNNKGLDDSIKNCMSNIAKISIAIDLDFMDNSHYMSVLDIEKLLKTGHLNKSEFKPSDECEYYIEGDLNEDGYVACKKHGSYRDYEK